MVPSPAFLDGLTGIPGFGTGTGWVRADTALEFLDDLVKPKNRKNWERLCAYCT
jgi:hypothetical protein